MRSPLPFLAMQGLAAATLALALASPTQAEAYPGHAVTVVVPYPPGGAADIFGRAIAHAMEPGMKQTALVENRPGAGGKGGNDRKSVVAGKSDSVSEGHGGRRCLKKKNK